MSSTLYLKGNVLLIIFAKYLKDQGISSYEYMNSYLDELLERYFKDYLLKIETNKQALPNDENFKFRYEILKREFVENELKRNIPFYKELSLEELEEAKKKIIENPKS